MGSQSLRLGRASALPLSAVLSALPSYPRPVIELLVARMIDQLDEEDGDADLEPNGDELDGNGSEEDFMRHGFDRLGEPGCPLSDPGGCDLADEAGLIADPTAYREHRARLRRTRCYKLPRVRYIQNAYVSHLLLSDTSAPSARQILRRKRGMPRNPRP